MNAMSRKILEKKRLQQEAEGNKGPEASGG